MPSVREAEYIARVNRVLDHIESHLDQQLSLDELARVAAFSRYHFHRIFAALVGETLNQFINRLRLERAATQLIVNPRKTVTHIALDCGFSSSATFARAFKDRFEMSATAYREGGYLQNSKIGKVSSKEGKTDSKDGKDGDCSGAYVGEDTAGTGVARTPTIIEDWSNYMKATSNLSADVAVEDMPEIIVAYVRNVGPYQGDSALFEQLWGRLMKWAGPRGLLQQTDLKCLCVYHDSPEVTDESKLRVSVCISVSEDTRVDGEIGKMTIPAGQYARAHFEIDATQYGDAWNYVYGQWMPDSGYQPDDRLAFELCLNDPDEHPQKKHLVDICVPVKPL